MRTELLSADRVSRILNRIAYQIVEHNKGADNIEIIGILKKGARVAAEITERVRRIEPIELRAKGLDVSAYRDDRDPSVATPDGSLKVGDLDGRDVILVDDVLFTGRTARAALDAIVQFGRPRSIQLVVLVDRGHREFPIHPDYVGKDIMTKHQERVQVDVDGDLAVFLIE